MTDRAFASLPPPTSTGSPLLSVKNLNVSFLTRDATVHAVNDVSFELMPGEVMCIIGESGSGKSATLRALVGLLPADRTRTSGQATMDGENILSLSARRLSTIRGSKIAMVFQEPMTALDPVFTIGDQIAETLRRHRRLTRAQARSRALELLELVRIPSPSQRLKNYPHELSGGLRQRALIAVALSCGPQLLLADEPTTALDATVQIQILILLKTLQEELGMAVIFVTHDLAVAAQIADKIAVMYAGRIIEYGPAGGVLLKSQHPYTRAMLASTVRGQDRGQDIETIPGGPPDLRDQIPGCSFAQRCKYVTAECVETVPNPVPITGGGFVRCIRVPIAAKGADTSVVQ